MNSQPTILAFAGPNGSGKSTVTDSHLLVGSYINADEIERLGNFDSLKAAQIAEQTREQLLLNRESFTFETVLSTYRNINLMERAKKAGYHVECIYVTTINPAINVERDKRRAESGTRSLVGEEKVVTRYRRAMRLIPNLCAICDRLLIFDNSLDRNVGKPELIVALEDGIISIYPSTLWTEEKILQLLAGEYYPEYNPE